MKFQSTTLLLIGLIASTSAYSNSNQGFLSNECADEPTTSFNFAKLQYYADEATNSSKLCVQGELSDEDKEKMAEVCPMMCEFDHDCQEMKADCEAACRDDADETVECPEECLQCLVCHVCTSECGPDCMKPKMVDGEEGEEPVPMMAWCGMNCGDCPEEDGDCPDGCEDCMSCAGCVMKLDACAKAANMTCPGDDYQPTEDDFARCSSVCEGLEEDECVDDNGEFLEDDQQCMGCAVCLSPCGNHFMNEGEFHLGDCVECVECAEEDECVPPPECALCMDGFACLEHIAGCSDDVATTDEEVVSTTDE